MTGADTLKKVFIGGTGRSGTTHLHAMVASHPEVYGIPGESKFIVEGDGIAALIPALTDRYSITASDLALLRFLAMMGIDVAATPLQSDPADASELARMLGPGYAAAVNGYAAALTEFHVTTRHDPVGGPSPRHFEDRADLIALTRAFISDLFGTPCRAAGKSVWCEKTPSNLTEIDLLWELFPEATFIHVTRDPRGVLHSLMQQDWAPHDLAQATAMLRHIYIRWQRLNPRLGLPDPRYLDLRLEDLAADPEAALTRIADTIGISPDFRKRGVNPALVSRWQTEMPHADRAFAERELADIFDLMGYRV